MRLEVILHKIKQIPWNLCAARIACLAMGLLVLSGELPAVALAKSVVEPVNACLIASDQPLKPLLRNQIAQCLGWQEDDALAVCHGSYMPISIKPSANPKEVRIMADEVSFYQEGRSSLKGNVEVEQNSRIVNAQTAYVYRDAKSNQITRIELLNGVRYREPGRLMLARRVALDPVRKTGEINDVLYRLNLTEKQRGVLPAWGRASLIQRFANADLLLKKSTYSTCPPKDNAWEIGADSIYLNKEKGEGVARNAKLYLRDVPVFYAPYFSFPTSKERKSGFLMPYFGQSNIGGFEMTTPYYLNLAPNYDATLLPQLFTRRGVMLGGQFRYLTEMSAGAFEGHYMPHDKAFAYFLRTNKDNYPELNSLSDDRWAVQYHNLTHFNRNLQLNIDVQQVSDDYYLQDFTNNLSVLTERQILRQGDILYTNDHWLFRGMLQSYYTLQPINATPVSEIYQRLPQLMAIGQYDDLPFNGNFFLRGQFDEFLWPNNINQMPEGPRLYVNPVLSLPQTRPWGYVTPSVELVQRNYNVDYRSTPLSQSFNRSIPRFGVDSGLYFDRNYLIRGHAMTQTLEPRVFYLLVPYADQTRIPVYDSAYMIFNTDQLFRTNRFSGFDRIGDTNQLSYALTSRWIEDDTGFERASFTIGQIRYFARRRVGLCQDINGVCHEDPFYLGFQSLDSSTSPLATRTVYHLNTRLSAVGDYVWDPATRSTNNANLAFQYEPAENHILTLGYTYLVNGDITQVANSEIQDNALNQITAAFAWPINDSWSTLGAYNYNISKGYEMMSFFGVQYDNCCWALRFVGGRTFQSLSEQLRPQYNNNVYLQILLKGLGSAGYNDPAGRIRTYLPTYVDRFHSR